MHLCINCNGQTVTRSGDEFTCETCGYRWDVAHEQANAAYLASQGRKPAQPADDQPPVASPDDGLLEQLGIEPVQEPAPDRVETRDVESDATEGYHLFARVEGQPGADAVEIDLDVVLPFIDDHKTIPDLEALAAAHGVDLSGAGRKAEKIEALLQSGALTVVYAPNGTILDVE
jgi:hypothetical protein